MSLLLLVVTGIALALQHDFDFQPRMQAMYASLWSVFLVNAAFIGTAMEARWRRISKAWMLLPIAWFGGYTLYAFGERLALRVEQAKIAQANAVRIPFDPARHQLVFIRGNEREWLVDNFALPVVFRDRRHGSFQSTRVVGKEVCDAVRADKDFAKAGIMVSPLVERDRATGKVGPDPRFCNLDRPERPTRQMVFVESRTIFDPNNMDERRTSIVTMPGGKRYILESGSTSVVRWLPMLVMGCVHPPPNICVLGDGCFFGFARQFMIKLASKPHGQILAEALGLHTLTPADRRAAANAQHELASLAETRNQVITQQLAALDHVLGGGAPVDSNDAPDLGALEGQLPLLLPRLPAMVETIEHGSRDRFSNYPRRNALRVIELVRSLPATAVAPYSARLDAVWVDDNSFSFRPEKSHQIEDLPARCRTEAQKTMSLIDLTRDLTERRRKPVSDADLIAAYHDPACYPRIGTSRWVGTHRNTPVFIDDRNGYTTISYGNSAACQGPGGTDMAFGPRRLCVPSAIAPLMRKDADHLASLKRSRMEIGPPYPPYHLSPRNGLPNIDIRYIVYR